MHAKRAKSSPPSVVRHWRSPSPKRSSPRLTRCGWSWSRKARKAWKARSRRSDSWPRDAVMYRASTAHPRFLRRSFWRSTAEGFPRSNPTSESLLGVTWSAPMDCAPRGLGHSGPLGRTTTNCRQRGFISLERQVTRSSGLTQNNLTLRVASHRAFHVIGPTSWALGRTRAGHAPIDLPADKGCPRRRTAPRTWHRRASRPGSSVEVRTSPVGPWHCRAS